MVDKSSEDGNTDPKEKVLMQKSPQTWDVSGRQTWRGPWVDVSGNGSLYNFLKNTQVGECTIHNQNPISKQYKTSTKTCCCSVAKSCLTLWDPMDCSMPGSLSSTSSQSLFKFMCFEFVMLSNHLILCHPLLLALIFPSIRAYGNPLQYSCKENPMDSMKRQKRKHIHVQMLKHDWTHFQISI